MAEYGYLNHTFLDQRDDEAINAIFAAVAGEQVVIEQTWTRGETSRPAFDSLLCRLRPGDTLYVSSIDRLGLDAEDTLRLWHIITKEKGADIVVLDNPDLNSQKNRKLTAKQLTAAVKDAFAALSAGLRVLK